MGVSLPINFFLKNFFPPNFACMADFAFWRCIFGSFQQNLINLYIKVTKIVGFSVCFVGVVAFFMSFFAV